MLRYAGFWRRAAAALVDGLLLAAVFLLTFGSGILDGSDAGTALLVLFVLTVPFIYHTAFDASSYTGSPGKRLMGLRVLDLTSRRLGLGSAVLRNAAKVVSGLLGYVGFAAAGFTSRKQGLHDLLARAVVVRDPLPNAAAFQEQVVADYRGQQDIIRIFMALALLGMLAGLSAIMESSGEASGKWVDIV